MIEEHITNAMADVRLELFRGNREPTMIEQIAQDYGLKPGVLLARLEKAYGNLRNLESWNEKSITRRAIEERMRHAIFEYADSFDPRTADAGIDIGKWLEERAGRPASRAEVEYADELWMKKMLGKLMANDQ